VCARRRCVDYVRVGVHQSEPARCRGTQRHRACHHGHLGTRHHDVAEIAQLTHDRYVEKPSERSDHPALAPHRDVEECTHDRRIKLRPRAARQFLASVPRRHGTLVRASRRHHFKGVGDRDDSRPEGDLISRKTHGVSRAVEVFVMLLHGQAPLAQPRRERLDHSLALHRMLMEYLPLLGRRGSGLIQDIDVDRDLPHVVQERGPSQSVPVGLRKSQFVGDKVGVRANALRVSTRAPIMRTESGHHDQNLGGCLHRLAVSRVIVSVHVAIELASRSGSPGDGKTRGRSIG
jgi:hypothetical protein